MVAPLVRRAAELEQAQADPAERALLGCWISPGWSAGLGLDEASGWAGLDPAGVADPGSGGLACVFFDEPSVPVPVELAQHVVHGAVAYARSLGFEPPGDFTPAVAYLGTPTGPTPIRFGRDGSPFYISGPYDNPRRRHRDPAGYRRPG